MNTPNIKTISDLEKFTSLPAWKMLKMVLYKLTYIDRHEIVAVGIRGDREVNEVKVLTHFGAFEIAPATDEEIEKATHCKPGFAGPVGLKIPFIADLTVEPMRNFLTGANKVDTHLTHVNLGRDCPLPLFTDLLLAQEGDLCPHAPGERYKKQRGIEVGHIFNLGTKYTEKLGALFQDETGETRPFWMGTYGIGVGRTAQAAIEQKHDEKGIIWPLALAPYRCFITAANATDTQLTDTALALYNTLQHNHLEPLYDDRNERLGLKLKDSDLLGIPFKIIVGRAYRDEGKFELETRQGEKRLLTQEELIEAISL